MNPYKPFQTKFRFYIEEMGNEWCLVDDHTGGLVGFPSKSQAIEYGVFARAYVKKHGDIDLETAPYDLNTPLRYEKMERPWWITQTGEVQRP